MARLSKAHRELLASAAPGTLIDAPLALIERDPAQPRQHFPEAPLKALAADIAARGVLQPVSVTVRDDGRALVLRLGERRCRAAELAGLSSVPALVVDAAGEAIDARLDQLAENALREDLDPLETADALAGIKAEFDLGVGALAEQLAARGLPAMSRPALSNLLRVRELPESGLDLVRGGALPVGHVKYLLAAAPFPGALDAALAEIARAVEYGRAPNTRHVQEIVFRCVERACPMLLDRQQRLGGVWTRPACDVSACADCACRRELTDPETRERVPFCTEPATFLKKHEAALVAGRARQADIDAGDAESVPRDDGTSAPGAATPAGEPTGGALNSRNRARAYLDELMRAHVRAALTDGKGAAQRRTLVWLWCATGARRYSSDGWLTSTVAEIHRRGEADVAELDSWWLADPRELFADDAPAFKSRELVALDYVLNALPVMHVHALALALGFSMDGYRVDEAFAATQGKVQLVELLRRCDRDVTGEGLERLPEKVRALRALLVGRADQLGVPGVLAEYHAELVAADTERTDQRRAVLSDLAAVADEAAA